MTMQRAIIATDRFNLPLVLFLLVAPVLLMFQGLDFTDAGVVVTSYQQVFSHPESVSYWFFMWLTNAIGGVFYLLLGETLGLLSMKIAAVLFFWATAAIVYYTLKGTVPTRYIVWGVFLGAGFQFARTTVLHYNIVTAFFYMLGLCFLFRGIIHRRTLLIFLSGFSLSLNVFARLPNLVGFALIIGLFYYGLL